MCAHIYTTHVLFIYTMHVFIYTVYYFICVLILYMYAHTSMRPHVEITRPLDM